MNKKIDIQSGDEISIKDQKDTRLTCGIIMPIATMSTEYMADHWTDVRQILHRAIEKAGFIPRIVSDSEESTVIHGSIINNIYNDAIIVCDVSNKNANVMFELGMRLAFNKPVVIVKDDKTDYSFDTGNIQHEPYRRDLRHNTVEKFIEDLSRKITKTYEASQKEEYQSFLSYFGKFEVAKIENKSIGEEEALAKLLNKMNSIESQLKMVSQNEELKLNTSGKYSNPYRLSVPYKFDNEEDISSTLNEIGLNIDGITSMYYDHTSMQLIIDFVHPLPSAERKKLIWKITQIAESQDLPF